jgi:regulator of protease activity HflC (stomatin/prohibitin superfamily)
MTNSSRKHGRRGRILFEVPIALVIALAGIYFIVRHQLGDGGVTLLWDHEVLVVVDNLNGELSADDRPGAHTFVPWIEEIYRLDRRPVRYVMGAGAGEIDRQAPPLIVRGSDHSSFFFGRVEVHAAMDAARADVALIDHGGERGSMLERIDAYARPVLRAAFGRYTAREIVLPENKQAATEQALEPLAAALARQGIRVLELSVSKPRFPQKYQETIDRRKVAEQDTERLVRERAVLVESADERERAVREREERKLAELRLELQEAERLAQRAGVQLARKTDVEIAEQLEAAQLAREEKLAQAAVTEQRHRAEAAAFEARLAAIESQGELAVRAALVERLGTITFDLVPYEKTEDANGSRVRRTAHAGGNQ